MPKIRKDNMSVEQKGEAKRLFEGGYGVSAIASSIGKSRTAVIKYLTDLDVYTPSKQRFDIAQLTGLDRRRLQRLVEAGTPYRQIAVELGFNDWQQARNTVNRLGFLPVRHAVVHALGKRRCHECKQVRPLSRFTNKGYLCIDCQWFYMARYDHGIGRKDLERILAQQSSRCAICVRKCRERRNLCVDHDHESGVVRGLLCTRCNTALGLFSDDAARMKRAIAYLRRPGLSPDEQPVPYGRATRDGRHYKRKAAFGLTPDMFEHLMHRQTGRCAVCRGLPLNKRHALAVDHDHRTRKIRGLLCENCNRGIGLFDDDPARIATGVTYLRTGRARLARRK